MKEQQPTILYNYHLLARPTSIILLLINSFLMLEHYSYVLFMIRNQLLCRLTLAKLYCVHIIVKHSFRLKYQLFRSCHSRLWPRNNISERVISANTLIDKIYTRYICSIWDIFGAIWSSQAGFQGYHLPVPLHDSLR